MNIFREINYFSHFIFSTPNKVKIFLLKKERFYTKPKSLLFLSNFYKNNNLDRSPFSILVGTHYWSLFIISYKRYSFWISYTVLINMSFNGNTQSLKTGRRVKVARHKDKSGSCAYSVYDRYVKCDFHYIWAVIPFYIKIFTNDKVLRLAFFNLGSHNWLTFKTFNDFWTCSKVLI